jgi:hypothetical protein
VVLGRFVNTIASALRIAAIAAVIFIFAGLLGFLTDEVRNTSEVQRTRIVLPGQTQQQTVTIDVTQPDPPAAIERVREEEHTGAREVIDDVGDVLMSPFSWIIEGSEPWVRRLLYSALGLILYGLVLLVVADWLRRRGDSQRRHQISAKEEAEAAERKRTGSYASPA